MCKLIINELTDLACPCDLTEVIQLIAAEPLLDVKSPNSKSTVLTIIARGHLKIKFLKRRSYLKYLKGTCFKEIFCIYVIKKKYNLSSNLHSERSLKSVLMCNLFLFDFIVKSFDLFKDIVILCLTEKHAVFYVVTAATRALRAGQRGATLRKPASCYSANCTC